MYLKDDKGRHSGNQHQVYWLTRVLEKEKGPRWWGDWLSDSRLGLQSGDQKFDNQLETHEDITRTVEISVIDRLAITSGGTIIYSSRNERETNFGMPNMDFCRVITR